MRRDHGFTIVEVLIALVLIAVMAAGLAGLVVLSARSSRDVRTRGTATLMAAQKMEQLRGLTWGRDAATGTPQSDTTTDLSVDPHGSGGPGLAWSPVDAADRTVTGYVDYLDAAGWWVGTGAHAPPAAVYVRRWSVSPAGAAWCDCVVLTVRVAAVADSAPWRDARLVSLRGRTARVE